VRQGRGRGNHPAFTSPRGNSKGNIIVKDERSSGSRREIHEGARGEIALQISFLLNSLRNNSKI